MKSIFWKTPILYWFQWENDRIQPCPNERSERKDKLTRNEKVSLKPTRRMKGNSKEANRLNHPITVTIIKLSSTKCDGSPK